jgi:hypothetical protein
MHCSSNISRDDQTKKGEVHGACGVHTNDYMQVFLVGKT